MKQQTFIDHAGQAIPFQVRATRGDEDHEPGQWVTCEVNPHGDAWQAMGRARGSGEAIRLAQKAWNEFDSKV